MLHPRGFKNARAGFTLVELVIATGVTVSLLLVAGLATDRALALFRQREAAENVSAEASRQIQRLARELTFARRDSLVPTPPITEGDSSLTFQTCTGVQDGAATWGPTVTLAWELESGELEDGLDNDGDGLIDEGQLVRTENPGEADEQRIVLAHGLCSVLPGETLDGDDDDGDGLVDERGLCFEITDDLLTITLGLEATGEAGATITKVVQTSVLLRN